MSDVALLSTLVAAEHAAVYGYGVLGARLDPTLRAQALAAFDAHRARRDELAALLRARGEQVPATQAAYDVAVAGRATALALAVQLEEGLSVRWRDLVAGSDEAALRRIGVAGLTETAVRAAHWRRALGRRPTTVALPGST